MKNASKRKNEENGWPSYTFLIVLSLFLAAGIVELLRVGMYNVPAADDYGYAVLTHEAWENTHSVFEVIRRAFQTSRHYWHTWQGLFSSAFVLAFMPFIFGGGGYAATAFITIASLFIGNTICIYTIAKKLLGAENLETGCLVVLINLVILQWMPSAVQGIYWYNGAMNYTFFYALFMVTFAMMIRYLLWDSIRKDIAAWIGLSVLGFIIAGGNHITAFCMLFVFLTAAICGIIRKNRKLVFLFIPAAFTSIGFFLNIVSPGTEARQAGYTVRPGVLSAVVLSVKRTLVDLNDWFDFVYLLVLLALLPILYKMAARYSEKTKFSFPYPLLMAVISVGILCSMRFLPYYAMGFAGEGRLDNVIYFVFIFLSIAVEIYILGWLHTKGCIKREKILSNKLSAYFAGLLLLTAFCGVMEYSSFYKAYDELKSGEAQQYLAEFKTRTELLEDEENTDVVLQPFTVYPELLYFSDIEADAANWKNSAVTQYYGKNSVRRAY